LISEVTMPSMGADMTEGTIAKWLKAEGDSVNRGDKIAEIETDKTVVEMEAYAEGLIRKIVVPEGTLVDVGTTIAFIGDADDDIPEIAELTSDVEAPKVESLSTAVVSTPSPVEQVVSTPTPLVEVRGGRVKASPIARKLAEEKGIDISRVSGTGPGGRITKTDVENFTPSPAFAASGGRATVVMDGSDTPLSSMRQAIARVTVKSKSESPHYYVTHEVNMDPAMAFRAQLNEVLVDDGDRVSVNDMVLRAVTIALLKYPKWNSSFDGDKLIGHSDINLGVAIALEEGLIVPAVVGIHNMSLIEISRAVRDIGRRARGDGGSLTQAEMTLGTFGTSNLGMFGTDTFAAIIVPPNAGIIAVGAVKEKPIVKDGQIVVGKTMNATISADHRVGDGAEAAILMGEFQKALENPARLMI
jgi:pyruvate dehydrogenase E2 component (dihydrolipoamide acetyltransferase)